MTVHPVGQAILATDLCSCGKPIADHKCPSSQGYAPRAPKTAVCRACGQKAHQNIDGVTVRLECLWRQFAAASGTLTTQNGAYTRVKLPTPDAASIAAFAQWVAQGSGARDVADPTQMVAPDTAAVLKRMQARAAGAAPMPDEQPQPDPLAPQTALLDAAADLDDDWPKPCVICGNACHGPYLTRQVCTQECYDDEMSRRVAEDTDHPSGCDDGCGPHPTITLDAEIVARPDDQPEQPIARVKLNTSTESYADIF